jgi:hypothetical protein
LLDHGQRADRDQDLPQRRAVDLADDHALEHETERAARDRGRDQRNEQRGDIERKRSLVGPAGERDKHGDGDVGADGHESGVREIQHIHQAEDQRQPGRHHEQHDPHGEAGDGQRQPGPGSDRRQRGNDHQRRERMRRPLLPSFVPNAVHALSAMLRPKSRCCSP